jgi:hypothetical protein
MTIQPSLIPDVSLKIYDAIEFDNDSSSFTLSSWFREDLLKSDNPIIVLFFGNSRTGKSLRLNQLLTRRIIPTAPFLSRGGLNPITKNFQYCPIPMSSLATIHNMKNSDKNDDPTVFLIDCEGLSSLVSESKLLHKAMFALSQIALVNVLVIAEAINKMNVEYVQTLLSYQKMLGDSFGGELQPMTVIMVRDAEVQIELEGMDIFALEALQKANDQIETSRAMDYFRRYNIQFDSEKFFLLAQPNLLTEELYWKSIDDLIQKIVKAAENRCFKGTFIVQHFEMILPTILAMNELDRLDENLLQILKKLIDERLETAAKYVVVFIEEEAQQKVNSMFIEMFEPGFVNNFLKERMSEFLSAYESKANKYSANFYSYFKIHSLEKYGSVMKNAPGYIEKAIKQHCISFLIPNLLDNYELEILDEISTQLSQIDVCNILQFNFIEYVKEVEDKLKTKTNFDLKHFGYHIQYCFEIQELIQKSCAKLSSFISQRMVEMNKEYQRWTKEENERLKNKFDDDEIEQLNRELERYQQDFRKNEEIHSRQITEIRSTLSTELDQQKRLSEARQKAFEEDQNRLSRRMKEEHETRLENQRLAHESDTARLNDHIMILQSRETQEMPACTFI